MKLTIHVQPNAKQDQIVQWLDKTNIKIKIATPAQQGKANQALIKLLAKRLGLAKSKITIDCGTTGRVKQLDIPLSEKQIHDSLMIENHK